MTLQEIRKASGLSQDDAANVLRSLVKRGSTYQIVGHIERRGTDRFPIWYALARAYNVPVRTVAMAALLAMGYSEKDSTEMVDMCLT